MYMEEKFESLNRSKVLIAEKDISDKTEVISSQSEEKKESAKKILFEDNNPQKKVEFELKKDLSKNKINFEFEAAQTFINENKENTIELKTEEKEEEIEVKEDVEVEPKPKDEKQPVIDQEIFTVKKEVKDTEKKPVKKARPGLKSRLKIMFFGFIAVLTCFIGWSIYNAVEIETLRAQMQESNKVYAVNIVNYINNISKTDDLTSADSLFNLDNLSNAKIIPIAPEIDSHIEYSVNSNWFDSLCNWLGNLFK